MILGWMHICLRFYSAFATSLVCNLLSSYRIDEYEVNMIN